MGLKMKTNNLVDLDLVRCCCSCPPPTKRPPSFFFFNSTKNGRLIFNSTTPPLLLQQQLNFRLTSKTITCINHVHLVEDNPIHDDEDANDDDANAAVANSPLLPLGNENDFRPPWKNVPPRYTLIATTALAFVICNMDKVNLSIAIIPMSHQFAWSSSTCGLVQSSFFWGYAFSQLPGGWLSKLFGGSLVLQFGVLTWSLATALVPLLANFSLSALVFSRVMVGIGEGVSPSAATDLIARLIPLQERSRAVSFVFGGLSVGSVAGLLLAPPFIQNFGWESVFYTFGFFGIAWFLAFQLVQEEQPSNVAGLISRIRNVPSKNPGNTLEDLSVSLKDVPWKEFFKSEAVLAMIYAHFCGSWGHYTCLSWLPTYFSEELDLNLTEAAWVSVLPPLASIVVTSIAAQLADSLISSGVETTKVRKICQTIAFLSPAICMTLASLDLGLPHWEMVGLLTAGLALSSFALSGLYCTHQDISPEYASILLGITNTVGAVPGIIGVTLTGFLLDSTHSWSISLFAPSIFFYLTGTVVWLTFASSKPQTFSKSKKKG